MSERKTQCFENNCFEILSMDPFLSIKRTSATKKKRQVCLQHGGFQPPSLVRSLLAGMAMRQTDTSCVCVCVYLMLCALAQRTAEEQKQSYWFLTIHCKVLSRSVMAWNGLLVITSIVCLKTGTQVANNTLGPAVPSHLVSHLPSTIFCLVSFID